MSARPFETPDRIDALRLNPKTVAGRKAAELIASYSDAVEPDFVASSLLAIGDTPPALAVFDDGTYIAYESSQELKEDLEVIDDITAQTGGNAKLVFPGDALIKGQ